MTRDFRLRTDDREFPAQTDRLGRPCLTRILVTCPYCGTEAICHRWSLAGSGKRCNLCGAIHYQRETERRAKGGQP